MSSNTYNIFLIRNRVNNYTYVGRTVRSIQERLSSHFNKAVREPKGLLHDAINKYGKENFTVELLYRGSDPLMEDTFMSQYSCEYNSRKSGVIPTVQWRAKCDSGRKGFTHSQETREKLRVANSGKKPTEEHRKKISKALMGIKRGPQSPEQITKRVAARKATLEKKRLEKMRETR